MSTKLSERTNGTIRTSLPRAIARKIEIYDREETAMKYEMRCTSSGPVLDVSLGPGVEAGTPNVQKPFIHSSGQVELELPRALSFGWDLDGCKLDWPSADDVGAGDSVTISAPVLEWEPVYDADDALSSENYPPSTSKLVMSGEAEMVQCMLPKKASGAVGLDKDGTKARFSFDCVGGAKAVVIEPLENPDDAIPQSSLTINTIGPNKSQAKFSALWMAAEFDVIPDLREGSVEVSWVEQDGRLVGFFLDEQQN